MGFAKAQGVSVGKLTLKDTAKGQRYVVISQVKGASSEHLLKSIFPSVIKKITFPKTMVWEETGFRFARPIRWIVSLFNTKTVRFELAGITTDKVTYGLLALGKKKIPVQKPDVYKSTLQNRCILVDPADRKKKILAMLEMASKKLKSRTVVDPNHLDEVVNLVEYPTCILGQFPEAYLKIPSEILISVLRKHQKFFPLETTAKKLINAFIGVRNGPSDSEDIVRDGYQRVLNARLSDAQFFFQKDQKEKLEDLVPRLSGVSYLADRGTLLAKTVRLQKMVRQIGHQLGFDEKILEDAERAAMLSKADLLTHIVGEFPELQGVAGRVYALINKENPDVAKAVEQHYWPLASDGPCPESLVGDLVAVADKLDTIAFTFWAGLIPTGSSDPYALRRHAMGIIRILIQKGWVMSLDTMIELALDIGADLFRDKRGELKKQLREFFIQRCAAWFSNQGYRNDEIEAVLANDDSSLLNMELKLKALKDVRDKTAFSTLSIAIKRARNILRQAREKGVLPPKDYPLEENNLSEQAEKDLFHSINGIAPQFRSHLEKAEYQEALSVLASLKGAIDLFFEKVMVMVEDEGMRSRRLKLIQLIEGLFSSFADFSKMQGPSDLGPLGKSV